MEAKSKINGYLLAAITLTIISAVYWSVYSINAYNTFHEYYDVSIDSYAMYYDIHYPSMVSGLQFLVIGNHLNLDQLIVLPIFYFYQSVITLLLIQTVILSFTGLLIFFVTRELLKRDGVALLLCFAFLVNPGMHGMLVFDYHLEMLIIPLYVLVFYYYMKLNRGMFLVSLVLLLGTMEVTFLLVIALALGLLYYEKVWNRDIKIRDQRLKLAYTMLALSFIALLLYNIAYYVLYNSYSTQYSGLSPYLKLVSDFPFVPITNLFGSELSMPGDYAVLPSIQLGFEIALFGLGLGLLGDPILTLILCAPWLIQALLPNGNGIFSLSNEYYGIILGSIIVANILGLKLMLERRGLLGKLTDLFKMNTAYAFITTASVFMIVLISIVSLNYTIAWTDPMPPLGFTQSFLFQVTPSQQLNYSQLNYIIALLPKNASVMTQSFVMPRLLDHEYVEEITPAYFRPDYILVDFNPFLTPVSNNLPTYDAFEAYLKNNNYTLYAENGTAMLYKRE